MNRQKSSALRPVAVAVSRVAIRSVAAESTIYRLPRPVRSPAHNGRGQRHTQRGSRDRQADHDLARVENTGKHRQQWLRRR